MYLNLQKGKEKRIKDISNPQKMQEKREWIKDDKHSTSEGWA